MSILPQFLQDARNALLNIPPKTWHKIWPTLIVAAGLVEWLAIRRSGLDDTLSEWTWSKINNAPVRILLGAFLVWLFYHFLWTRPPRGLGARDIAAVALGAVAGLASYIYVVRMAVR